MKISVAGAGAGKTTKMASKIFADYTTIEAYQNIYCLAFTNAAVSRIKEKLLEYYVEIPSNIIVCTLHSFLYQEIICPYHCLLFGKHYDQISLINLPNEPAYKNKKIKDLDDRGIIHVSVIPQRAKWVVAKKSGDKKKEKDIRVQLLKTFSCYCGKIFIDEAQDIDDDIAAIIQALDVAGVSIELIGDPKQDLRGHGSFRKLLNKYGVATEYISVCHRCPQEHLKISNLLVPDAEKQTSTKTNGTVNVVFENDIQPTEFLKANAFDLAYISARNDQFETHSQEGSESYFASLNHEISEVVKQQHPCDSQYQIAKTSYYLAHCMIEDIDEGLDPRNIIKRYFKGSLDKQQYAKIISALKKPTQKTVAVPVVSTVEGIKGQDGKNCLFILTTDLAPYLFGEKTAENKTKNKLYVALTRSLDKLSILITLEVEKKYGRQYILDYFDNLLSAK